MIRRRWVFALLILAATTIAVFAWHRTTQPEYRLSRGERAIEQSDWELVERYAVRLESSGASDHAHLLRGLAFRARRRPDLALEECNRIRGEGPIHLRAATLSGMCLLELNNHAEAVRVLNYVVDREPNNVEAHRALGAAAYDLGQLDRAVAHLERVAELDTNDGRPHRLIGLIYRDLGEDEPAITAYRTALDRRLPDRTRIETSTELAGVLVRRSRFTEALEALDAVPATQRDPESIAVRADSLRGLARGVEAIGFLDRAIAADATAEVLRVRGQIDLDRGSFAQAAESLERAAALAPGDYRIRFLLALALDGSGRRAEAEAVRGKAESLRSDFELMTKLSGEAIAKPWDAAVRQRLADTAERLGNPKLADVWRRAAQACKDTR